MNKYQKQGKTKDEQNKMVEDIPSDSYDSSMSENKKTAIQLTLTPMLNAKNYSGLFQHLRQN